MSNEEIRDRAQERLEEIRRNYVTNQQRELERAERTLNALLAVIVITGGLAMAILVRLVWH